MFAIWLGSLFLALASLLLMASLVISRVIEKRRADARAESEVSTRMALVSFAGHPDEDVLLAELKGVNHAVVADQASDVLCLVRGELAPRLRTVLETLGIAAFERKRLQRGLLPTRVHAAEFLGFFNDESTARALRKALGDRAAEVRIAAAISLSRRGDDFDILTLLAGLQATRVRSKRLIELFEVLLDAQPDDIIPLLHNETLGSGMKALIIDGMCRTKSPTLTGLLAELMETSRSPEISAAVIRSSAALCHPQSLEIILENLDSAEPALRLAATEAAGLLGVPDTRIIQRLAASLDHTEWAVRLAASSSLMAVGPDGQRHLQGRVKQGARPRSVRTSHIRLASSRAANG